MKTIQPKHNTEEENRKDSKGPEEDKEDKVSQEDITSMQHNKKASTEKKVIEVPDTQINSNPCADPIQANHTDNQKTIEEKEQWLANRKKETQTENSLKTTQRRKEKQLKKKKPSKKAKNKLKKVRKKPKIKKVKKKEKREEKWDPQQKKEGPIQKKKRHN